MADTIRLNKVLRELNISIDRVAEFLESKGHVIEKRPTTKISTDLYNLLCDEFQIDADKKLASKEAVEAKNKEKEEIREKQEKEQNSVISNSNEVIKASSKVVQFKKVGKIDLEPKKEIKVEKVDSKPQKEPTNEVKEQSPSSPEESGDDSVKKDNYKKLTGLKSTGEKIDLNQFKKPETDSSEAKSKKKRKRIVSNKGNAPQNNFGNTKFKQKGRPNRVVKEEPSEEEVQKQIKETLEKLQGKSSKGKAAKYRKDKRDQHKQKSEEEIAAQEQESKILKVTEFVTANEIATMMDVSTTEIISACMTLGMMVTLNQRLDAETLSIVAEEFGYKVEFVTAEIEEEAEELEDSPEDLMPRPPIVTVMGHVDHGKTSLLDYIRKENVIAGESGGITQHIGAYAVELQDGQKITFLDTPGHEAFAAMRARGAKLTDIVIIVIAADSAVMPQTKEAINHAKSAEVPIIIAINKIDTQNSNPDKIKEELSKEDILVEDWGGKFQCQEVSAKTGKGIDELLEKIVIEAEMQELKTNPKKLASGTIVESSLDKGRGYLTTLMVQGGTLKKGDIILSGPFYGKVKALFDYKNTIKSEVPPSTPILMLGLNGAPQAGEKFIVVKTEKEAREVALKREKLIREQNIKTKKHITLDEIGRRISVGSFKELNIVIKGDVDGSIEALSDSMEKLSNEELSVKIIHRGVGEINESDVLLASAADGIVVGFQVRPSVNARKLAEKEGVEVRLYSIIYEAIEEIKKALEGLLAPTIEENITGSSEVRETYKISKIGTIAGCYVTDGKILRKNEVRLIRDGVVIFTGKIKQLKRFKDDANEVKNGYECGILIEDFNDIKVGDLIECFEMKETKRKI